MTDEQAVLYNQMKAWLWLCWTTSNDHHCNGLNAAAAFAPDLLRASEDGRW
jgi:hypothetical protein